MEAKKKKKNAGEAATQQKTGRDAAHVNPKVIPHEGFPVRIRVFTDEGETGTAETRPRHHSPGNGNAGVSTGDQAVLLLRVDHSGVDFEKDVGVDYWTGSTEDRNAGKWLEL